VTIRVRLLLQLNIYSHPINVSVSVCVFVSVYVGQVGRACDALPRTQSIKIAPVAPGIGRILIRTCVRLSESE
jgi:hypothetical protein